MPGEVEQNRQVIQAQESTTNAQSPVRARSRSASCAATSILIGLTQGFGIYLVSSNLSQIQGSLGATGVEALYLTTAYFSSALTATVLLTKFRLHFGLRQFALLGLVSFLIVSLLHLATNSLGTAIAVRIALGVAAAPLSTLAAFYMMEAFPPAHVRTGLLLGFCVLQLGAPLSRVVSPDLLELGRWHGLFLLDVALAILSVAAIHAVPLTPVPTRVAFNRGDVPAFVLYATGMGLLCVFLSLGTSYWWTDAPWLGYGAAGSIALLAAYVVVDFPRENPLLNLRWMVTPYMLRFFFSVVIFRIVLSEQSVGVVGLMTALGQNNEQMHTMFLLASAATVVGFGIAVVIAARGGDYLLGIVAAAAVAVCAALDSSATSLTRPHELYVTQTVVAAAQGLFFGGAALLGFMPVVKDGSRNIVSFLAAFSAAQFLGSLLGSAWMASTVFVRQKWHFAALAQHLSNGDPSTLARINQLSGSLGSVLPDSSARAAQGLALLYQQVNREAIVLAYDDLFQQVAWISVALTIWMCWIRWAAKRRLVAAALQPSSSNT